MLLSKVSSMLPTVGPSPRSGGATGGLVNSFRSLSSILTLRSMERSRAASWRSIILHVSPSGARQASRSIAALSSFAFSAYANSSRTLAISSSSRRSSSWRPASPGGS